MKNVKNRHFFSFIYDIQRVGDLNMRKTLKIIFFSSLLGVILAGFFFFTIKEKAEAKNKSILYAYQVGVFKSLENANNYLSRFSFGKVMFDGEYYRVFIGITIDNKNLLSSLFDKEKYNYYIKELEITEEIAEEIKKYDALLAKSNEENQIVLLKKMLESYINELQN